MQALEEMKDEYADDFEEADDEVVQVPGGRYITDALMLKCATNAKSKDKKELLKKEGRSNFLTLITHMNLEGQKLVSIELNEEVA